jgi:hypothetical protein
MRAQFNDRQPTQVAHRRGQADRQTVRLLHHDDKLLADVRGVAAAHGERRLAILKELQMLAGRMGMLPGPRGPFTTLETAPAPELAQAIGPAETAPAQEPSQPSEPVGRGGDWRQTTANTQDYLTLQLKTRVG